MKFKVNDTVVVVNSGTGADGLAGKVIEVKALLVNVWVAVKFEIDVGIYTNSKGSTDVMVLPESNLKHYQGITNAEYDKLIDLALDSKDKAWFDELVSRKKSGNESEFSKSQ